MKRQYTWKPDLPDQRDHPYSDMAEPDRRPQVVDLRPKCPPVVDQGELGCCTASALAGAIGTMFPTLYPSRLFLYYNALVRVVPPVSGLSMVTEYVMVAVSPGARSPVQVRTGLKILHKLGACQEKSMPYMVENFKRKPRTQNYASALRHRIAGYKRLTVLQDMLNCLASGIPFVFGFSVYESFESSFVARTGVVDLPGSKECLLGGHVACAVGYDIPANRFTVRNSWGTGWGSHGYFTIPFKYLADRSLSDDFWMIRK